MRLKLLILILFSQTLVGFSQTASHAVSGTVTDPYGAVIPNAEVTAIKQGSAQSNKLETKTNEDGDFIFKDLSEGKYKVSVTATGFGSETERLVSVPQDKSVEIKMGLGCDKLSDDSGSITDEDKTEILKLAFEDANHSGLSTSEQRKGTIIVSTENIETQWLKDIADTKIEFLSLSQIQEKADNEGDFMYMSFPYIKVKGLCVAVEISNTWAVGKNSTFIYMSGGGNRYEFRKESGKWVKKYIGGWVS